MTERKCCYLEGGKANGLSCQLPAEWEIYSENNLESIEACTLHVGELLDDSPHIHVYPISQEKR